MNVGSPDGTGDAPVKKRALVLAHQNALVNATVNLFNEDGYLQINNADKTGNIAGLNGKGIIAGESSGVAADSPDTLNLVQKDGLNTFTGTIADTVSLVRSAPEPSSSRERTTAGSPLRKERCSSATPPGIIPRAMSTLRAVP